MQLPTTGRLLACLCILLLASCSTLQKPGNLPSDRKRLSMYEAREAALLTMESWSLDGKLAVSDGKDGGSGRLEWRHQPGLSELDFRGALGRGAWQLEIRPEFAVLSLGDGEVWQADDVSELVREHVGWDVPVDTLAWWVRGLAAPGLQEERVLDESGLMTRLSQVGWEVEYRNYEEFSGIALPTRLDARNGPHQVKFVMRQWTLAQSPGNG